MRNSWKSLLIVALVVTAAYHLYPTVHLYGMEPEQRQALQHDDPSTYYDLQKRAINLGLDLQGGSYLVYEVDLEKIPEDQRRGDEVDRAIEIITNRVDQFGVAEPIIQKLGGNRIVVQLPGLQEPAPAHAAGGG